MEIIVSGAIGPVHLGDQIGIAVDALRRYGGERSGDDAHMVILDGGLIVQLEPSRAARVVRSVEVWGGPHTESVMLGGFSLLATPADELLGSLAVEYSVRVEDAGQFAVIDELLVALWRPYLQEGPDHSDGLYFESVLVAAPGYYAEEDEYFEADLDVPKVSQSGADGEERLF